MAEIYGYQQAVWFAKAVWHCDHYQSNTKSTTSQKAITLVPKTPSQKTNLLNKKIKALTRRLDNLKVTESYVPPRIAENTPIICFACKKERHVASQCQKKARKTMPFQQPARYTSHDKINQPPPITARATLLEKENYKNEEEMEYYKAKP